MRGLQFLASGQNMSEPIRRPHFGGGKVGMASGPVPVALVWFGVKRGPATVFLGNYAQEVARDNEVIAYFHGVASADLEFPLGRHDFGIGPANLHAGGSA